MNNQNIDTARAAADLLNTYWTPGMGIGEAVEGEDRDGDPCTIISWNHWSGSKEMMEAREGRRLTDMEITVLSVSLGFGPVPCAPNAELRSWPIPPDEAREAVEGWNAAVTILREEVLEDDPDGLWKVRGEWKYRGVRFTGTRWYCRRSGGGSESLMLGDWVSGHDWRTVRSAIDRKVTRRRKRQEAAAPLPAFGRGIELPA